MESRIIRILKKDQLLKNEDFRRFLLTLGQYGRIRTNTCFGSRTLVETSKVFSYYLQTAKTGKELVLTLRIVLRTFARVEKQGWCYAMRVRTTVTEENALLMRV